MGVLPDIFYFIGKERCRFYRYVNHKVINWRLANVYFNFSYYAPLPGAAVAIGGVLVYSVIDDLLKMVSGGDKKKKKA